MKNLSFLLLAAALLFSFNKPGVSYPFDTWDAATLEKANSAKDVTYMTDDEKKVVFYINLVRLKPDLFDKTFYAKFRDSTKAKETSFSRSLHTDLTTRFKPMDIVTPKEDLSAEAKDHAIDSGKSGKKGHTTSDNKSFSVRMEKFKGVYGVTSENCDYGMKDPLGIVIDLLVDEAQAAVEHRKLILDKKQKYVGVSIQPHKKEKWTCVMDFAY